MRVLVADDAILFRRVLAEVLASLPGVEVVGTAANGQLAIRKVRELHPDVLTLDIEMPEMDGLAVLDELRRGGDTVQVIVVSALSRAGGDLTVRALEKGAFDFITKSEASGPQQGREALARELAPRVRAIAHRLEIRSIMRGKSSASRSEPAATNVVERVAATSVLDGVTGRMQRLTALGEARNGSNRRIDRRPGRSGPHSAWHSQGTLACPYSSCSICRRCSPSLWRRTWHAKCAVRVREAVTRRISRSEHGLYRARRKTDATGDRAWRTGSRFRSPMIRRRTIAVRRWTTCFVRRESFPRTSHGRHPHRDG